MPTSPPGSPRTGARIGTDIGITRRYRLHFKCSLKRIADYPNLWPYVRDLYQEHEIADTVRPEQYSAHYYRTHPSVNPSGIVALQPAVVEFTAPHGREHVGARYAMTS